MFVGISDCFNLANVPYVKNSPELTFEPSLSWFHLRLLSFLIILFVLSIYPCQISHPTFKTCPATRFEARTSSTSPKILRSRCRRVCWTLSVWWCSYHLCIMMFDLVVHSVNSLPPHQTLIDLAYLCTILYPCLFDCCYLCINDAEFRQLCSRNFNIC